MDELVAIGAYQRGHAEACAVLFELHAAHVYRTAYLITRDAGRAEDIAQETLSWRSACLGWLPARCAPGWGVPRPT